MNPCKRPQNRQHEWHRQSGAGLVEGMVAVTVLGLGLAGSLQYFSGMTHVQDKNTALISMTQTAASLGQYAASRGIIRYSAQQTSNGQLKACVEEAGTCNANTVTSFTLYNPGGTEILAGPTGKPAEYDRHGRFCTNPAQCAYTATIEFRAICPNNQATCSRAQTLMITYEVVANNNKAIWKLDGSNTDVLALKPTKPMRFTKQVDFNFAEIWKQVNVDCNGGALNYASLASMTAASNPRALQGLAFNLQPLCATLQTAQKGIKGPQGAQGNAGPGGAAGPPGDPGPAGSPCQ